MGTNRSRKARIIRGICAWLAVLAVAGGGIGFLRVWGKKKLPAVPTAEVSVGEFIDYVQLRGEVKARSSTFITAPFNSGDLQIIKLSPNGGQSCPPRSRGSPALPISVGFFLPSVFHWWRPRGWLF